MTITLERTPRGTVVLRTNECVNPRIGSQASWENLWFGAGGTGTDSWKANELDKTWTNNPTDIQDAGWSYDHGTFTAGTVKTASADIYPYLWAGNFAVKAQFMSGATILSTAVSPIVTLTINQWNRVSGTFTAPAGTTHTKVRFVCMPGNKPGPNQGLAIQRVLIEPGTTLSAYFDGDTYASGFGTQSTVWAGTRDAAPSQLLDWDPATKWNPQMVLGYDVSQQSRNIVHQLADGPVAATLLPASSRQGTLRLFFLDAAGAEQARTTLAGSGYWAYTDTDFPAEAMTFVVDGQVRKAQTDTRLRWTVDVPYRELT